MMLTMVCGKKSTRRRKSSSRRGSTKAAVAEEGEGTRAGEAVAFTWSFFQSIISMQVAVRRERIFSSDICVNMLTKPNRKRRRIQESIL